MDQAQTYLLILIASILISIITLFPHKIFFDNPLLPYQFFSIQHESSYFYPLNQTDSDSFHLSKSNYLSSFTSSQSILTTITGIKAKNNEPDINTIIINYTNPNNNLYQYSSTNPLLTSVSTNSSTLPGGFNFPINEEGQNLHFLEAYPQQIRLSWTENSNEMRVTWVTYINYASKVVVKSTICIENLYTNNWTTFYAKTQEFDEGRDKSRIQYIHTVVIPKLQETCVYDYLVGNSIFWSSLHSFKGRTPYTSKPESESLWSKPTKMIVVGDWGAHIWGIYTKNMLETHIKTEEIDWLVHLGDIAYNMEFDNGQIGDDFLTMIEPISAEIPYMVIPGNHEFRGNFSHYANRFKMPVNDANDGKSLFYSYNIGPVHYIMMNLEYYFKPYDEICILTHKNWVIEDLVNVSAYRDQVSWIVVFAHHSFYCSVDKKECLSQADDIKNDYEEMFKEYAVDLVVQGHVHNYERDFPVYKGQVLMGKFDNMNKHVNPQAPVYIINGNAGNDHLLNDPFQEQLPDFYAFGEQGYGYGKITAFNRTHMLYEQYDSETATTLDYVWIIKDEVNNNRVGV